MAFGDFNQNGGQPMSEINTTPLVDVMLVLLIIFMVTAPLMTQAIGVDLPTTEAVEPAPEGHTISIELDREGHIRWDGTPLPDGQLAAQMRAAAAEKPQPTLHLQADRLTPYEQLAQVLASARSAGLNNVGLVTLPE